MVFGLWDTIVEHIANPKRKLVENTLASYYEREGFSKYEARGLAWTNYHRSYGQGTGLLFGLMIVIFQEKRLLKLTFK